MTKLTIVPKPVVRAPRLANIPAGSLVVMDGMLLQKVRNEVTFDKGQVVILRVVLPCPDDEYDGSIEGAVGVPGAEVGSGNTTDFHVPAEVEVRL